MFKDLVKDLPKSHVHLGSFLLRLGLAIIFIFHGYLKVRQGGGTRWHDELTEATQVAVAWGETLCGAALLLGWLSRLAALGIIIIQMGAIILQTGPLDFIHIAYLRSGPAWVPTGYEYNFALIVMALAVIAIGSGRVSLDYLLFGRGKEAAAPGPSWAVTGQPTPIARG